MNHSELERECAAAVLSGEQVCIESHLPCWACVAVDVLVHVLRHVTTGQELIAYVTVAGSFADWSTEPGWLRDVRGLGCEHVPWPDGLL